MKLENFLIVNDSIAVEYKGNYLDLHNNYNFTALNYNIKTQELELKWVKSKDQWAEKELYDELKFVFNSVSVFSINPRDTEMPFSEDECLAYIGYLHPEDIEFMNGFLPAKLADETYHLVFGFQSESCIKIYSETARLIVQ